MKAQKNTISLCKMAIGLLILTGCTTSVSPSPTQSSVTLSATVSSSPAPTPEPSRSPIPTLFIPTPEPTLPSSHELRVNQLLQDENCKLPCYLGIVPGKTTLNEAKAILESVGAKYSGKEYKRNSDGAIYYTYILNVGGQPAMDETPSPDGSIVTVSHHVSLITDTDVVQIIEASAGTVGPGTSTTQGRRKFREYWSRYTARGIFLQLGLPDHLYTDTPELPKINGSTLLATYEKVGVVVEIYGTGDENNICPELKAKFLAIRLSLFNPSSSLSIYGDGRVRPTERSAWLPLEEVLGVDTQEFYRQLMSDPLTCFEPKIISP